MRGEAMNFFTRIDPAKNIRRFWLSTVTPTLLGGWSLVREWGRIGSPGRMESRTFDLENEARRAEQRGIRRRERHGYQPATSLAARWPELMAAGGSIQATPKSKSGSRRGADNSGQRAFDF